MAFLLDTKIAIDARDGHEGVLTRISANRGGVFMSALTLAELQRGLHRGTDGLDRRRRLELLLAMVPVLAFDAAAADTYGHVIGSLGRVPGRDFDRMIAGHAIALQAVLVTANMADFCDIPGLVLENWAV